MSKVQDEKNKYYEDAIEELKAHAKVSNEEMGQVQQHLSVLETDMKWIKDTVQKVDARMWLILGTIILGIVMQIALMVAKK